MPDQKKPIEKKDKTVDRVRKSVEKKIEIAEKEKQHKLLSRRLALARAGIDAYGNRKIMDSQASFLAYLKVLEEIKNVKEGGLTLAHFDAKQDLPELLMISGIYWDLVKIYDRTQSPRRYREFLHYLEKYQVFSKGMPYQALCAESIRKYLAYGNPNHRSDFTNTYRLMTRARCFVATSLVDVISPETLPQLRAFRDDVLKRSPMGRNLILFYYRVGPNVAQRMDSLPSPLRNPIRKAMAVVLNGVARLSEACRRS